MSARHGGFVSTYPDGREVGRGDRVYCRLTVLNDALYELVHEMRVRSMMTPALFKGQMMFVLSVHEAAGVATNGWRQPISPIRRRGPFDTFAPSLSRLNRSHSKQERRLILHLPLIAGITPNPNGAWVQ